MDKRSNRRVFYELITQCDPAKLEEGTVPWRKPMDYFLQHVITDAEIVRASQPSASAMLLHVILELVERHCGQEVFVLAPFLLHAAAYQLWHGGCHLGGYVTHLLYFDDVKTGMLSIGKPQAHAAAIRPRCPMGCAFAWDSHGPEPEHGEER